MDIQEVKYIPSSVLANKAGYDFLSELHFDLLNSKAQTILISFDRCREFDANLSAVLGAILDDITGYGHNILLSRPISAGVRRFLARNKFLKAFNIDTSNEDRENFIEYKRFNIDQAEEFKSYIHSDLIQRQRFPHCTDRAKEKIIESIYEIFANAVSHGNSKAVYCSGEVHPRKGKTMLDITFINLGTTVINNVNTYLQKRNQSQLAPCAALKWAFEEGNTTKPIPGGLGLSILEEFIEMNEGTIQMVSGNAMLEIENGNSKDTLLEKSFSGTIVNVEFNCSDTKLYSLIDEQVDLGNLF